MILRYHLAGEFLVGSVKEVLKTKWLDGRTSFFKRSLDLPQMGLDKTEKSYFPNGSFTMVERIKKPP